jgi:D-glycero-alpha-D-manno-heptose-7-phosphate kinase
LLEAGITKGGLEISSLSDLPSGSGLGSSSSFTCVAIKGLSALRGQYLSKEELAREACRLEIDVVGEAIGKQDQYAAAYGGFNVFQFNKDESVDIQPLMINHTDLSDFKDHLMLFYTGVAREAVTVLADQQQSLNDNIETYKQMSDSVDDFKNKLLEKDFKALGEMLHQGWLRKKSLSDKISNKFIDALYEQAIKNGAWGGKVLGAGGGGSMLFIADPSKHSAIRSALVEEAKRSNISGFEEIDFSFTQSGTDVLFNNN